MSFNFFDNFDRKMQIEKSEQNILEEYSVNTKISKTIVPTFEIMFKEDGGFGIYVVEDEDENAFTVKGNFISPLIIGQTYKADGTIGIYNGEKQLNVSAIINVKPISKKGIISYMQTLKGLKTRAYIIYDAFGDKSIDVLIDNPMKIVRTVKGIGEKLVRDWQEQLEKMKESQYTMTSLLGYGLTNKQAKKLYDKYGDEIITKIEDNPYCLSWEVKGYGFLKCDRIARNVGYDVKSKFRIQEGIMHVMEESTNNGHCYLPTKEVITEAISLLNVGLNGQEMEKYALEKRGMEIFQHKIGEYEYPVVYNKMVKILDNFKRENNFKRKEKYKYIVVAFEEDDMFSELLVIHGQNRIIMDDDRVYLKDLYYDEIKVATKVCILMDEHPFAHPIDIDRVLNSYLLEKSIILEDRQRTAVIEFASNKGGFFILNGSAGCGKTFTLKIILEILGRQYNNNKVDFVVQVFAPTGKASKVVSKATKMECKTVHRGLKYNPSCGFEYNEENPIEANCIVVDESSMLDISLTKHLLTAIEKGTKVIFMGDTKQLPSVGAGNVLHDLIESEMVKIITLNVVKRQGEQSGVIRNANKIIEGLMIETCVDTKDAYVIKRSTAEGVRKAIIESTKKLIDTNAFDFDDIQILCPQKTSVIGTYFLNYLMQKEFNKEIDVYKILASKFHVQISPESNPEILTVFFKKKDKVIHIKNNYDMEWYKKDEFSNYCIDKTITGITNGECGKIEDIVKIRIDGTDKLRIIVRYEDKFVFYDDGFEELELSYALTFHKSQGSQWKAIISPIMMANYNMLDNNLFYTGYTRAEQFVVTIGEENAIRHAIKTHRTRDRYTFLKERMLQLVN